MIYSWFRVWEGAYTSVSNTSCTLWSHWPWGYFMVIFISLFYGRDSQTSGTHLELFNERPSLPKSLLRVHHQSASFWSHRETRTLISLSKAKQCRYMKDNSLWRPARGTFKNCAILIGEGFSFKMNVMIFTPQSNKQPRAYCWYDFIHLWADQGFVVYRVLSLSQTNRHDNWEEVDAGSKSKLTSDFSFGKINWLHSQQPSWFISLRWCYCFVSGKYPKAHLSVWSPLPVVTVHSPW